MSSDDKSDVELPSSAKVQVSGVDCVDLTVNSAKGETDFWVAGARIAVDSASVGIAISCVGNCSWYLGKDCVDGGNRKINLRHFWVERQLKVEFWIQLTSVVPVSMAQSKALLATAAPFTDAPVA